MLREAMRTSPSIVYLPHLNEWWHVITEAVRASFVSMFNDLDPSMPVLLLATSDVEYRRLYPQVSAHSCCGRFLIHAVCGIVTCGPESVYYATDDKWLDLDLEGPEALPVWWAPHTLYVHVAAVKKCDLTCG